MSRLPVYSDAPAGGDRVLLDSLGVIRGLRLSTTINGDWVASWQANLTARLDHRAFQPGRIITVPVSPTQAWQGVLGAPQRGTPWQFTADGLAKMLDRWSALAPTSNNALNLNEIVDQAISRGLAFGGVAATRPASLPSLPAGTQPSGTLTLAAALSQVTAQLNQWWNISRSLAITAATLPTSLTYILQAQDTAGGRVLDGFVTDVTVLYLNAATYSLATLQRSNTAMRTKYGRFEGTPLDLTTRGPLTTAQAQAAGDNYLTVNAPRLKFAGAFQAAPWQILNAGGAPVDPATVTSGFLTRLLLTDPDTNAGELSLGALQTVTGQTDYDVDADQLTLTPLDYSAQGLAALVGSSQPAGLSAAAVLAAQAPQLTVLDSAVVTAAATGIASGTDISSLASTKTYLAGKTYLVEFYMPLWSASIASAQWTILPNVNGGGQLTSHDLGVASSVAATTMAAAVVRVLWTPGADTVSPTFHAPAHNRAGGGTFTSAMGASVPGFWLVTQVA